MSSQLEALANDYPLPPGWRAPELFSDTTKIRGLCLSLAGVTATNTNGMLVWGSAAEAGRVPLERGYFELLERVATVEAKSDSKRRFAVRALSGERLGSLSHGQVFPRDPAGGAQRYCVSNGVALHSSWQLACESAALELVERDRVLRGWYGEGEIAEMPGAEAHCGAELSRTYDLRAFRFSPARADTCEFWQLPAVGVFGFPRTAAAPLIIGFAARRSIQQAIAAAANECLQRLGFLWGEPIPDSAPEISLNAEYHSEYYLVPAHHAPLRAWLRGAHSGTGEWLTSRPRPGPIAFADLTPSALRGRLHVARAICPGALPLVFGRGHPAVTELLPSTMAVHPIP